MNGLNFCPWLIWPINMVIIAEGNLMLIDFCTKKTFFFINNEAQGGRKRSFGAKTHITRKRKQRAFQPMWSEISKSNSFRGIFINICNYFPRGNPTLGASTICCRLQQCLVLLAFGYTPAAPPPPPWPSAPAKEGTRYSLNLVVSGHKQLWSPPAANRLPMWLRNNASTGHSK